MAEFRPAKEIDIVVGHLAAAVVALSEGTRPVVAYCPMVRKAWIQPDEPIGNPYAPSMLRCGEVVQR